jgi:isoquinoline 1-oxidoreductase beta subunit
MNAPLLRRREFLVLASAGLALGAMPALAATESPQDAAGPDGLAQRFLAIAPDGTVTVFSKHVDMGQGIWSGLASIIADELDADWAHVTVVGAPARLPDYSHSKFPSQVTGGSTSTANSWDELRMAGAVARAMLVAAAAAEWKVPPEKISVSKGIISSGKRSAGIGHFAAAAARLPVPKATPKAPKEYVLIGKDSHRLDIPAKSRGQTSYGIDTDWPGIRPTVVARAPRFGATLIRFDDKEARKLPGVIEIVRIPTGVAVIGETTWHAMRGRAALVTEWDETHAEKRSSDQIFRDFDAQQANTPPTASTVRGAPDAKLKQGRIVEAAFEFPFLTHAALEPLGLAGRLVDGRCELRAGFQSQTTNQKSVADILGLPIDKVFLDTVPAGGSFGRRASFIPDWVDEMAEILKATKGRWPIKLTWSRDDDVKGGHYRPLTIHRFRAALGADGSLAAVEQRIVGQTCFPSRAGAPPMKGMNPGVSTGNFLDQYAVPDAQLLWWNPECGVPAHTYRAVSNNHNGVAKEIFIDRCARAADADPVAYRMALLAAEPRQQGVLRLAAEKIGWDTPPPAGRVRGVAVHRADGSSVCEIVELSGTPDNFRIERVVAAIDCGVPVNPDTIRAQTEGGIGFALSGNLYSSVTLTDGHVDQSNYNDYRVLRIAEMPKAIEVHIVPSTEAPTGIGEPGSVPITAAVVNALERMGMAPVRRFPVIGARTA